MRELERCVTSFNVMTIREMLWVEVKRRNGGSLQLGDSRGDWLR